MTEEKLIELVEENPSPDLICEKGADDVPVDEQED